MHRIVERYLNNESANFKHVLIVFTIVAILSFVGHVFFEDEPVEKTEVVEENK